MSSRTDLYTQAAIARTGTWFQSLPADLCDWLLTRASARSLAAGQRLFARGDAPDGIYCVTQGTIRINGTTASGQEALLAMLEAPNWFGEIALFDNEPRTHDAWAESDATLLRVTHDDLRERLRLHPGDWSHFGRLLTQKLRILFTSLEELALMPPTARVARRLATMAAGYGSRSDHSARVVRVSQEQLAMMLALSRQTVNHSLKELELEGAIRRNRGAIEVMNLAGLAGRQG